MFNPNPAFLLGQKLKLAPSWKQLKQLKLQDFFKPKMRINVGLYSNLDYETKQTKAKPWCMQNKKFNKISLQKKK